MDDVTTSESPDIRLLDTNKSSQSEYVKSDSDLNQNTYQSHPNPFARFAFQPAEPSRLSVPLFILFI